MKEFPLSWAALSVLVGWLVIEVLTRVKRPKKTKLNKDSKTGESNIQFQNNSTFDEIEPQGSVIPDNLHIPAILHYARPSGLIDVKKTDIVRIYGFKDARGVRIASVMGAPSQPGRPLTTHQFYRIRSMEDPSSGTLMVDDADKAKWLVDKGRIV